MKPTENINDELSDELYVDIMTDLEEGDKAMEEGDYAEALACYEDALTLIPDPKTNWEVSLHIYTAMGDVCFNMDTMEDAVKNYNLALQCPSGTIMGYVWLGMGQSYFELDEMDNAKDALMSAYMLDKSLFEDIDGDYFDLIKEDVEKV